MFRRRVISKRGDKKMFSKTARKVHKKNMISRHPNRGGIRL